MNINETLNYVEFEKPGNPMAQISLYGEVFIDWNAVELAANSGGNSPNYHWAVLMLAVRDGTWKAMK